MSKIYLVLLMMIILSIGIVSATLVSDNYVKISSNTWVNLDTCQRTIYFGIVTINAGTVTDAKFITIDSGEIPIISDEKKCELYTCKVNWSGIYQIPWIKRGNLYLQDRYC